MASKVTTAGADLDESDEGAAAKPQKTSFLAGLIGRFKSLSRKQLMLLGGALLLVVVLAGAAFYFFGGGKDGPAPPKSVFHDLPELVVNLATTTERPQFLRLKITLEVADAAVIETLKPMMPRVLDTFQVHLRELRAVDLEGSAGLFRLREELTRRVNRAIAPARIKAVLFKEIVVQ